MATGDLLEAKANAAGTLVIRSYEGGHVYWHFYCPACKDTHQFSNRMNAGEPGWDFDGNQECPTFSPSLRYLSGTKCHLFLKAGVIEFCGDCPHAMRGTKAALPIIPPSNLEFLLR